MIEPTFVTPVIPSKCVICGAWRKKEKPYLKRFELNVKVFYKCGCGVLVRPRTNNPKAFVMEIDECWSKVNLKVSKPTLELISHNKPLFEGTFVYSLKNLKDPYPVFPRIKTNKPFLRKEYFCLFSRKSKSFPYYEDVDKSAKIHYGQGALPIFSTFQKAVDYIDYVVTDNPVDRRYFAIENFFLEAVYRLAIKEYSHAIVDPDTSISFHKNYELSDLTTLRF